MLSNTDRYVYTSTVSVYADFTIHNVESSPLGKLADESIEEVNGETYGPLKALCEKRVANEIAPEKLTIIRPTYVCGPRDHTDRFSYWPIRTRRGGEMLWPGTPQDVIQIIDVNDLANFTLHCIDNELSGIYNAVNAAGSYTMGDLLEDSQAISGVQVDAQWISEDFAYENDIVGRTLPIWNPTSGESGGSGTFSGEAARAAGLHNRPERETARNVLAWWDTQSEERRADMKAGLSAEREAALLAAWKSRNS